MSEMPRGQRSERREGKCATSKTDWRDKVNEDLNQLTALVD